MQTSSKTLKSLRLDDDGAAADELNQERITAIAFLFSDYTAAGDADGAKFLLEVERRWPDATEAEVVLAVSIADEVQKAIVATALSIAAPAGHA